MFRFFVLLLFFCCLNNLKHVNLILILNIACDEMHYAINTSEKSYQMKMKMKMKMRIRSIVLCVSRHYKFSCDVESSLLVSLSIFSC